MNIKIKELKGITLISLVITVVIMLILAGVSINLIIGNNGLFNKASTSADISKLKAAEEKLELMLQEYRMDKAYNDNSKLEDFLNQKQTEGSIQSLNKTENIYEIEIDKYTFKLNGDDLIIFGMKEEGTLPQIKAALYTIDGQEVASETKYDKLSITVKIENKDKFDSINFIKLIDDSNNEIEKNNIVIGDSNADASFIVNRNKTYKVLVEAKKDSTISSNLLSVKVDNKIEIANVPQYWHAVDINDSSWYDYGTNVNKPKLVGGMVPIAYDNDVTGMKWANAMTSDGSMWVWIPRYAYKISSGYHTQNAGTIQIKFIDTDNNYLDGSTGNPETDPGRITYNSDSQNEWLVHPTFTSNADNGGGFGELSGIWVGKFETTGTTDNLSVKPGEECLGSCTINEYWNLGKDSVKASFGESADLKQHMIKNSEYGAIAYLTYSSYGLNKSNPEYCNTSYAGGSNDPFAVYETNKLQSSTKNAYGVYGLSGGEWECVAAYPNISSSCFSSYGADLTSDYVSTAYKTVYPSDRSGLISMKGDAMYEIYLENNGPWFGEYYDYPVENYPFMIRTGCYSYGTNMLCFGDCNGAKFDELGSRECLAF